MTIPHPTSPRFLHVFIITMTPAFCLPGFFPLVTISPPSTLSVLCELFSLWSTSRVPIEGKSSVCLICMKYRIKMLIIFIFSLGKILWSYIANTSRTHARMHARSHRLTLANTHTPTHDRRCVGAANHGGSVMVGCPLFDAGKTMIDQRLIEINNVRATQYLR